MIIVKFDSKGREIFASRKRVREIAALSKSASFKPLVVPQERGSITFSVDVEWNPKLKRDWRLSILTVPDLKKSDHDHFELKEQDIIILHRFLGRLRRKLTTLK